MELYNGIFLISETTHMISILVFNLNSYNYMILLDCILLSLQKYVVSCRFIRISFDRTVALIIIHIYLYVIYYTIVPNILNIFYFIT